MSPVKSARKKLAAAKRVAIKIGSRALVDKKGRLDRAVFRSVALDLAGLADSGRAVVVISSGAILAGRSRLGLMDRDLNMPQKQAAAAVGQNDLMREWAGALSRHGIKIGQVLVTAEDLGDRRRFLNSRNTLSELLRLGVVPVINENDSVAVEEIRYGDNDHLATLIVGLMEADCLIILTDIDGLCAVDPEEDPHAPVLHMIKEFDAKLFTCAGPSRSGVGSGGMATKIEAARTVARRGVPTMIANAKKKGIIKRIMAGEDEGTLFVPEGKPMPARKYWMAFAGEANGDLVIDEGAKKAVTERGKSLLPSGLILVRGRFDKGDLVRVVDEKGREIARGLTNYSLEDLEKIKGKKSGRIETILGQKLYEEAIHRDYLVLTGAR